MSAPPQGFPYGQPAYPYPQYGYAPPQGYPQAYAMPAWSGAVYNTDERYRKYGLQYNPYDYNAWGNQQNFVQAPVYNFTPKQFQKLRNHSTKESALKQMNEIGCDVSTIRIEEFTQPITRVCFCCLNTYTSESKQLGVGPLNDGITVGACHRLMGYFVYYLHNPKSKVFLKYLKMFLSITSENLTVYYSGHGSQVRDTSGDEDDGYDEVMVFEDDCLLDDVLAKTLRECTNKTCRYLLLNDCCRSGTIWDIPKDVKEAKKKFPASIVSISAARDSQTSKQTSGLGNVRSMQGLFTFHFCQAIREDRSLTPNQVGPSVGKQLQRYQQNITICATKKELLNEPIFPQR